MDRALWLLLRLRLGAYLRHWGRHLRTPEGLLLAMVGSLLFLPWAILSFFSPRIQLASQLALIRQYGALGLFAFCLLNILLSSEDRTVYFAPAEVDFLFTGPFRRRQLIIYRMVGEGCSALLTALFMTLLFAHHATGFLPAFVGLFLMIELMVLVALAVGLVISTMGALAFNRRRKMLFVTIACLLVAALVPVGQEALSLDRWKLLDLMARSTILRIVVWPFRPSIMAFMADRLWPDLAIWTLSGLAILAVLATAILVLHAEYYEATANASAKNYARIHAARLGRAASRPIKTRIVVPPLPCWGGIGPNLWRQLLTATRHPDRLVVLLIYFLLPLVPIFLVERGSEHGVIPDIRLTVGMLASMTLAASLIAGFDFRSDIDRMDLLKTLPIAGTALVIGELGVPVLLLSLAQAVCLAVSAGIHADATYLLDSLICLPLFNALLVEIEAILFLWFPARIVPGSTMAFTVMSRQFLLMFAKMIVTGIAAGVAVGIGALVYYFLVPSRSAALAVSWLFLAGIVLSFVPLVVLAFQQYDVARDSPL